MHIPTQDLVYLGLLVGILLVFRSARRSFLVLSILILPGTICHELCHLFVGALFRGRPVKFTVIPKREGRGLVLGSVAFAHIRWYNAFFIGMAPVLLLPAAYGILVWRLGQNPVLGWGEALGLFFTANLIFAAMPSWPDLRIAVRSPIGWLLLIGAVVYGWGHVHADKLVPQLFHKVIQAP